MQLDEFGLYYQFGMQLKNLFITTFKVELNSSGLLLHWHDGAYPMRLVGETAPRWTIFGLETSVPVQCQNWLDTHEMVKAIEDALVLLSARPPQSATHPLTAIH